MAVIPAFSLVTEGVTRNRRFRAAVSLLFSVAILALTFLPLFTASMNAELIRDENMFVALGALLSRTSLLPYRDFPYIHTPYLGVVFALVTQISDRLLLSSRMVSVAFAWLTLVLLYVAAWAASRGRPHWQRGVIATGTLLIVLVNPVFQYTARYAWNHQLSTLLALASFLLIWHARGRGPGSQHWVIFSAGILLGLAAGVRLTWVTTGPAYLLLLLTAGGRTRERWTGAAYFVAGTIVANLPILSLLALYPREVWFGVVEWHRYDTLAHELPGFWGPTLPMSLRAKAVYMATQAIGGDPAGLMLYFAAAFFFLNAVVFLAQSHAFRLELLLMLAVLLSIFIGVLAPTPVFYSYFYAPIPWLALTIVYSAFSTQQLSGSALLLFTVVVAIGCLYGVRSLGYELPNLRTPESWQPNRVHAIAAEIKAKVREGPLLTLDPVYAAEAGREFYEPLVVGAIVWRAIAPIPLEERSRFKAVGSQELGALLRDRPPTAILLSSDDSPLEQPMLRYAQEGGYRPIGLEKGLVLWTLPEP